MSFKDSIKRVLFGQRKGELKTIMYGYVQCQGCGAEARTSSDEAHLTVKMDTPCARCSGKQFNCHVTNTPTPPEWWHNWKPYVEPVVYKVGDRIRASDLCRFNRGFTGVVSYVEPSGTLWVRRDGAGSDVYYHPEEVEHV